MKSRKSLLALALALIISSSMNVEAYSESKLDKIQRRIEKYIGVNNIEYEDINDPDLRLIMRVQAIVHSVPVEKNECLYKKLVASIQTDELIKDFLKNFIDDEMCCVAKESIIYANLAENEKELYSSIYMFITSRYNGNAIANGVIKDVFLKEEVHIFDNREGIEELPKKAFVFYDYSSYGDYRVYSNSEEYQIITNQDNKILACISNIDFECAYTRLDNKDIAVQNIESYLKDSNIAYISKDSYTSDEISAIKEYFEQVPKTSSNKQNAKLELK